MIYSNLVVSTLGMVVAVISFVCIRKITPQKLEIMMQVIREPFGQRARNAEGVEWGGRDRRERRGRGGGGKVEDKK